MRRIRSHVERHRDFYIRYAVVGFANTLVGIGAFPLIFILLEPFSDSLTLKLLLSYIVTGLVSYFSQRTIVFRSSAHLLSSVFRFVILQVAILGLNTLALPGLIALSGLHPIVGQLLLVPLIILGNLLGMRFWVFPNK